MEFQLISTFSKLVLVLIESMYSHWFQNLSQQLLSWLDDLGHESAAVLEAPAVSKQRA